MSTAPSSSQPTLLTGIPAPVLVSALVADFGHTFTFENTPLHLQLIENETPLLHINSLLLRVQNGEFQLICRQKNTTEPPVVLREENYTAVFSFYADNDHPLLKTVPQPQLYPPHLTTSDDNPYLHPYQDFQCSAAQARTLLEIHIPDLDPHLIATFPYQIRVRYAPHLDWPAPTSKPDMALVQNSQIEYLISQFCLNDSQIENIIADCSATNPYPLKLYRLRNRILTQHLLPHLQKICHISPLTTTVENSKTLWTLKARPALTDFQHEAAHTLYLLTNPATLFQAPAYRTSSTMSSLLAAHGIAKLSDLLPPVQNEPPPFASPANPLNTIFANIQHALAALQASQLSC